MTSKKSYKKKAIARKTKRKSPPKAPTLKAQVAELTKVVDSQMRMNTLLSTRILELDRELNTAVKTQNEFTQSMVKAVRETRSRVYLSLGEFVPELPVKLNNEQFVAFLRYCNKRYRSAHGSAPAQIFHRDRMVDAYPLQMKSTIESWFTDMQGEHSSLFAPQLQSSAAV